MKKITSLLSGVGLLLLPIITFAQLTDGSDGGEFQDFLENVLGFIDGTLIPFIIGIGFFVFVWGMFWYFIAGGANDEKKEKGRSLMIWATAGFLIIIVFWGVINILADGLVGGGQTLENDLIPTVIPG